MKSRQILPDDDGLLHAVVHQFLLNTNSKIREEFKSEFQPMKVSVSLEDIVQKYEASSSKEEVSTNVSDIANSLVYKYLLKAAPETSKDFSKLYSVQQVSHSLEEVVGYCQKSKFNSNPLEKESSENNSDFTKSIVYEYLSKAATSTSKEFLKVYSVQSVAHSLEDVVGFYQKPYLNDRIGMKSDQDQRMCFPEEVRTFKDPDGMKVGDRETSARSKTPGGLDTNVKGSNRKVRKQIRYTQEEDKIIYEHLHEYHENLDLNKLGRVLGRSYESVKGRVRKIKNNLLDKPVEKFTDLQRKIILDMVLENRIRGGKLSDDKVMTIENWKILTIQFCGRRWSDIRRHWQNIMQPWLLQHFSGTLNLQIDKMLVSCIADNFDGSDIDWNNAIDWDFVVRRPEFLGHTISSLKQVMHHARRASADKNNIGYDEVQITHLMKYVSEKKRVGLESKEISQRSLIEYFHKRVDELGVTDFV